MESSSSCQSAASAGVAATARFRGASMSFPVRVRLQRKAQNRHSDVISAFQGMARQR